VQLGKPLEDAEDDLVAEGYSSCPGHLPEDPGTAEPLSHLPVAQFVPLLDLGQLLYGLSNHAAILTPIGCLVKRADSRGGRNLGRKFRTGGLEL